jgi:hypothetical protein
VGRFGKRVKRGWWVGENGRGGREPEVGERGDEGVCCVHVCISLLGYRGRRPSVNGPAKVWWWISLLEWGGYIAMRSIYSYQGRMRFAMDFEHFLWKALTVDLRVECMILT